MDERRREVVKRLRDSWHKRKISPTFAAAYRVGATWAETEAEAMSLLLLRKAFGTWTEDEFRQWVRSAPSRYPASERIYSELCAESRRSNGDDFWDKFKPQLAAYPDEIRADSPEFYWGFIRGALEFWAEFESEVTVDGAPQESAAV